MTKRTWAESKLMAWNMRNDVLCMMKAWTRLTNDEIQLNMSCFWMFRPTSSASSTHMKWQGPIVTWFQLLFFLYKSCQNYRDNPSITRGIMKTLQFQHAKMYQTVRFCTQISLIHVIANAFDVVVCSWKRQWRSGYPLNLNRYQSFCSS